MPDESVSIYNKGGRVFRLSGKRALGPGDTLQVSVEEAKSLTRRYSEDIVESGKIVVSEKLIDENARLRAELAELKAKNGSTAEPVVEGDPVDPVVESPKKRGRSAK